MIRLVRSSRKCLLRPRCIAYSEKEVKEFDRGHSIGYVEGNMDKTLYKIDEGSHIYIKNGKDWFRLEVIHLNGEKPNPQLNLANLFDTIKGEYSFWIKDGSKGIGFSNGLTLAGIISDFGEELVELITNDKDYYLKDDYWYLRGVD